MICADEEYKEVKKQAALQGRSVSNFLYMIYKNWLESEKKG